MPFDLGDTVPLSIEVRDQDGNLAAAGAVALTITKPDMTTTVGTVTNPSTGVYRCDFVPTVAGPYRVRWVATGVNASAYTDAFDVRQATPPLIFSLADARAMLNRVTAADNEKIRDLLESTTSIVEDIVGPVVPQTVTEVISGSGMRSGFALSETPVIAIQSILSVFTTGGLSYLPGEFDVDSKTGVALTLNGRSFAGTYRVTYTAGRVVVPAAIRDASRLILRHLWSLQLGPHSGPRDRTTPVQNQAVTQNMGRELPSQVIELLRPYARTGSFA